MKTLVCKDKASEFDMEVFKCHNQARTDPTSLIPLLEAMLPRFDGKLLKRGADLHDLRTKEGAAAVHELIAFLKAQAPLSPLEWQQEMMLASRDHVLDTGATGHSGHTGSDGSSPQQRCQRYVTLEGMSGENIDYGQKEAMQVILALAIDDGVPGRGHRRNLFEVGFKRMSCFTGRHKTYGKMTVINYNGSSVDMQQLMNKDIDFGPVPSGAKSWSDATSCQMSSGGCIKKTSTRTYNMADGSTVSKVVEESISIHQ